VKSQDEYQVKFGKYLKERREAWGFTQRSLGQKVGVEGAHIAFLESGRRRPSLKLLSRLADALEVDRQEILLLARPEAKELVSPPARNLPKKTSAVWDHFIRNRSLLGRYRVTSRELQVLEHVSLLGKVSSVKHLLAILMLIRDLTEDGS
jgi:transcriptional regulator with XRE-family HTH domain